jgi:hypothetical protein
MCVDCNAGTWSNVTAAFSVEFCEPCPNGQTSTPGSVSEGNCTIVSETQSSINTLTVVFIVLFSVTVFALAAFVVFYFRRAISSKLCRHNQHEDEDNIFVDSYI